MEFGLCIPHYGKPLDIPKILDTVRRAEELGFDSVWVTDHLLVPQHWRSSTETICSTPSPY